ncbi:MAG: Flp family type IVb pilin [Alphaproteobacteria bacterium]|nr:Flp family type IVb pilin [Alphaproteobacteria bacterium]
MHDLTMFLAEEDGNNAIEYGLIVALIFLAILGAVSAVAANTSAMWNNIATHVNP